MTVAFKIISAEDWAIFRSAGHYAGSVVDRADGYIHMSTAAQLPGTAGKHYAGLDALVLLTVSLEELGPELKWEPSRGGELFPHLYADLPLAAVIQSHDFAVATDGSLHCPDGATPWA
ncbi:DUF952 domain-containing protein [Rhizobium sp. CRIBSB]|nr:DUF952 domain-containing protein [Rhizobium sp. CRIBSB]